MALEDWVGTAASNTTVGGVNIAENCPAAGINNAIRAMMADVANGINIGTLGTFLASTTLAQARTALGVAEGSTSTTAFGALTNEANKVPYMTGSDAWATTALTSFARTLLDDGDAATARATLGAIGLTISGSASSGSAAFTNGATTIFKLNWVDATASGETSTAVTWQSAFSSWSRAWCNGGNNSAGAEDNDPFVVSSSTTGASVYNAQITSRAVTVFAWGV